MTHAAFPVFPKQRQFPVPAQEESDFCLTLLFIFYITVARYTTFLWKKQLQISFLPYTAKLTPVQRGIRPQHFQHISTFFSAVAYSAAPMLLHTSADTKSCSQWIENISLPFNCVFGGSYTDYSLKKRIKCNMFIKSEVFILFRGLTSHVNNDKIYLSCFDTSRFCFI